MTREAPEPQPMDERSITVIHSPQARFRRVILVMFVVMGLLVFQSWNQSRTNGQKVEAADERAEIAVEQNRALQDSLDELIELQKRDQETQRIRSERTTAFIIAVLTNSTDPVLREAARRALEDVEDTSSDPRRPTPSPTATSNSRSAPRSSPAPSPRPSPSPTRASPSPSPSPSPEPGTVDQVIDTVCAVTALCQGRLVP